jgi:hypothetical protein
MKVDPNNFVLFYIVEKAGKRFLHEVPVSKAARGIISSIVSKDSVVSVLDKPTCEIE